MTKSLITILLVVVVSTSLFAQLNLNFGIRAGANYANNVFKTSETSILSNFLEENEYRLSYHFGIVSLIKLNEKISISPELLFSSKGYRIDGDQNSNQNGDTKFQYNYISFPIFLNFHLRKRFQLNLGPEFNYLVAAKAKLTSETVNLLDILDFNRFEFGLGGGVSAFLTDELSISIRYFHGLTTVLDQFTSIQLTGIQGIPIAEDAKFINRNFQLSLTYLLN